MSDRLRYYGMIPGAASHTRHRFLAGEGMRTNGCFIRVEHAYGACERDGDS
jgi:hypothetical protein